MSEGYKDLLCMLERCLKPYFLWENNNSSSVPGFSRVKLRIIILSMESTCPSRAFPLSNATTSNASSAHTGPGNSGKVTGSFLSGWLLILLVAVHFRLLVGRRDAEVVLLLSAGSSRADRYSRSFHKIIKWFLLEETFKDSLVPSFCRGQEQPLLDEVALSPVFPGLNTRSGVHCLCAALMMFLPRAPDTYGNC